MKRIAFAAVLLVIGCAHSDISLNAGTSLAPPPPAPGTSVVSSGVGLQVNASGGVAAALAAGVVIAVSFSNWFSSRPAPEMDPGRTVNEQDCTKPIQGSGNLRCR